MCKDETYSIGDQTVRELDDMSVYEEEVRNDARERKKNECKTERKIKGWEFYHKLHRTAGGLYIYNVT